MNSVSSGVRPPVSIGTGRLNSSGEISGNLNTGSSTYNNVIAAGATIQIPIAGDEFYLILATGQVIIKPNGGSVNPYSQGTGNRVRGGFTVLEVYNPSTMPVVISMVIAFDGFIDNRTILFNNSITPITYPTYGAPNTLASVAVPDLSGQFIVDLDGTQWIASSRVGISISNISAAPLAIYNAAGTKVMFYVMASTSYFHPSAGGFLALVGSGNINGSINEIYAAIAPSTS